MITKRFRIHAILVLTCLVIIIFPMISQKPDPEKAHSATAAALQFLKLIDAEQYDRSWQTSADLLKKKVTVEEWSGQLSTIRSVTGPIIERKQKDISYATTAKDSPDGEYILLIFDSRYQGKESVTETVTMMLEQDNNWRVAGYFIQ